MPNEENPNCERCGGCGLLDQWGYAMENCPMCFPAIEQSSIVAAAVKSGLAVEPVSNRYKLGQGCGSCGALPSDWANDPWENLPWIVTLAESGNWRFLIDRRDPINRDMFSGFKINRLGSIGDGISWGSGAGGRLNLHRSYFLEDLPA